MKNNIVIIGMGNMGKRHLQAVANLSIIGEILCYDISHGSLDSVPAFLKENNICNNNIRTTISFDEIIKAINAETIVIIATTAQGRHQIIANVITLRPLAIIAEKPLCQSIDEYEMIMALSRDTNVPLYVNFPRHMYGFYREIYESLKGSKAKGFSAVFSGGMGCIGIHLLDLLVWILEVKTYKILFSDNHSVYHAKRAGYCDLAGVLLLSINDTNVAFLHSQKDEGHSLIEFYSQNNKFRIYESEKKMVVQDVSIGIDVREIDLPFTSQLTDKIITALIQKERVELPNISQSYLTHKILFDYIKINRLEHVNIT
ncbi:MAG: Gfo/Idh/MocA family oxidoreductase [Candidatus Saganbacteria bacterium]|nr:Gfo/Idh/MocA family oxidoreductase [Candidatus Saganbacteria bacterium]